MENRWIAPEDIAQLAQASDQVQERCTCSKHTFNAWESLPITFPEELLICLGTVSPPSSEELTVEEYHPDKTNYWSPDAPIAFGYFPANRSEVWQCRICQRCYLRYTEFGGYYVDRRIRSLRSALLVFPSRSSGKPD